MYVKIITRQSSGDQSQTYIFESKDMSYEYFTGVKQGSIQEVMEKNKAKEYRLVGRELNWDDLGDDKPLPMILINLNFGDQILIAYNCAVFVTNNEGKTIDKIYAQ